MVIKFISWPCHLTLESQDHSAEKETLSYLVQLPPPCQFFGMTWLLKTDYFLLPEIYLRIPFSLHPPLNMFRVGPLHAIGNSSNSLGLTVLEQCYSKSDQQIGAGP